MLTAYLSVLFLSDHGILQDLKQDLRQGLQNVAQVK